MDTATRISVYGPKPTGPQRRRIAKKAGRDPNAIVVRDDGMGYPPGMQGYREVVDARHAPTADMPATGTGRGHHAVEAWIDEMAERS